jgi:hypothetical protein
MFLNTYFVYVEKINIVTTNRSNIELIQFLEDYIMKQTDLSFICFTYFRQHQTANRMIKYLSNILINSIDVFEIFVRR